eukprot:2440495-Amphidinium_carterae.1
MFTTALDFRGQLKAKTHHDMLLNRRKALRVLSCCGLCVNSVVGVLLRSGVVQVTYEVRKLVAEKNSFAGSLPDGGMRAMQAVTYFSITENSFAGTLPKSGFREVIDFSIHTNRFAGALPDGGMRAMQAVSNFAIAKNSFTGMLSESGILRK